MLQDFEKHINQNLSFLKNSKLLIAISGGVDSVVLTHLLHQLNVDISLAHCNFKLRGAESDLDETFVKELATELNIDCYSTSFDTEAYAHKNKLSIQMAARKLRYDWFKIILEQNNLDFILTAHHQDDVLETFLINLTRGTGLEGLTGIPEINKNTVRPLLPFSRDDVLAYAKKYNIKWREDQSNASTKYLRNKIRHDIVPVLKELNLSLLDSFKNTQEHLRESQEIINDRIEQLKSSAVTFDNDVMKIDISSIKSLANPKIYLYELLKEYQFTEWNDIVDLLDAQSGKQVFSKSHRIIKDRDFLLISKLNSNQSNTSYSIEKDQSSFDNEDVSLTLENEKFTSKLLEKSEILVDKELLKFPLIVRKWKKGDYFCPVGMRGTKKLSKFFKDEKYSLLEKEKALLLCTSENEIIWIIGKRADNRFKSTPKTNQTLKIILNR